MPKANLWDTALKLFSFQGLQFYETESNEKIAFWISILLDQIQMWAKPKTLLIKLSERLHFAENLSLSPFTDLYYIYLRLWYDNDRDDICDGDTE